MFLGVDVSEMCDQHLLGLNKELSQIQGTIEKHQYGKAIVRGHFQLGQVSTDRIEERHDEVVKEMERRGMNPSEPLEFADELGYCLDLVSFPFEDLNRVSLFGRCSDCRRRSKSVDKRGVKIVSK